MTTVTKAEARRQRRGAAGCRPWSTVAKQVPFRASAHRARRAQARTTGPQLPDYPADGDKRCEPEEALERCGLRDGMVISTHHHLRNGDRVALTALETAARLGAKDLMWFPSASFPCHAPVIDLMEAGVVHHIEGSMNGPLGDYCSQGKMRGMGVLRSHGGRWQAIQDGEVKIDIAVIAAPTADAFGNADGSHGPSACGSLGFALADSIHAEHVIVVTDNLVPFPCIPWQIQGNNVDYVVEVDSIGDPAKIVSGTTRITKSPERLRIAEQVARLMRDAGIMRDGFSFQAGAGGIALAFVDYLARRMMREAGVTRPLRARRLDPLPRRDAAGGSDRLHPRRPDLRPRRRAVDRLRPAPRADLAVHLLQLPRQGQLRLDGRRRRARRDRGRRQFQRQRQHALRRTAAARHRGLAELPDRRLHDPRRTVVPRPHPGDRRRGDDDSPAPAS